MIIAGKRHVGILVGLVLLFLFMDLFPQRGAPAFRYSGSDPDRVVLNLGLPLPLFIYDEAKIPPLAIGPFAQMLVPLQVLILGLVSLAPSITRWFKNTLQVTALTRRN